jgi:class 3 adenylate cyclase/tetratricopeptide (TPR) repeat protein/tRNA A-37 threonylcarbamoyl transferase component Bud32
MPDKRTEQRQLAAMIFTDIVESTRLKQELGDRDAVALIRRHHSMIREILARFPGGEEVETAGDSFFIVFRNTSDAVQFSLLVQTRLRGTPDQAQRVQVRIGIHVGEVLIEELNDSKQTRRPAGIQVDMCARVMSLAQGNQILMTRFAFDNARAVLRREQIEGVAPLTWMNHGPYVLKGVEEPVEVCEVGEASCALLKAPANSEKAHRYTSVDGEPVLGWRPALDQAVPNTKWTLEKKLGEGGFGEVWLGEHETLKEKRVFKFCFRADRVRSLKREVTLFRLLKERVGHHPNIVGIQEVFFDQPPFYIVMDYAAGQDLRAWCEAQGGVEKVPLRTRLEIVAQVADALHAAHEAGVIHRDVKPSNILISDLRSATSDLRPPSVKLTDFGIGQVVSQEALVGLTQMGFTQTVSGPGSSSHTGTQMYMAPELLAGHPASHRSDIYSLGVVLFQLLVGDWARPLTTDWAKGISDPLAREDLERCFAGKPEERFTSAQELAHQLRTFDERRVLRFTREKAAKRRRILRLGAGITLLSLFCLVVAFYSFKVLRSRFGREAVMEGTTIDQASFAYQEGRASLLNNPGLPGLTNAVRWFLDATQRDTNFAAAYAYLAFTYRQLDLFHEPGKGWDERAWTAASQALALNKNLAIAYVVRGGLFFTPARNWRAAEDIRDQRTALRLDPLVKTAHFELAFVYNHLGFLDEAVQELQQELALHRGDPTPIWLLGGVLLADGKYSKALEELNLIPPEVFPHRRTELWLKAMCQLHCGQTNEASARLEKAVTQEGFVGDSLLTSVQAILDAANGQTNRAKERIAIASANAKPFVHFHHVSYNFASAYALMHEDKLAIDWLKKAANDGYPCYPTFTNDLNFKSLWRNPEFGVFVKEQKQQWQDSRAKLLPKAVTLPTRAIWVAVALLVAFSAIAWRVRTSANHS